MLGASACGSSPAQTPPITRAVTQTPWIIYVNVTTTPEPATVTPLPTVAVAAAPTRTATKSAARPTATKAPPTKAPVAAAPTNSPAPACSLGTVTPYFPENGVTRTLNANGTSGPAFQFKWTLPTQLSNGPMDASIGYRIDISSRRPGSGGGQLVNGDVVYVSHNTYIQKNEYDYEGTKVRSLGGGDDVVVSWTVTVVKSTEGFDDQGHVIGTEISCGAPSAPFTIQLTFQ
jgi:hypothetical protein